MTQSSQKVISPGSNFNISGPVPGTFQHTKDTAMVQPPAGTPKTGNRRPPMLLPNVPAPGKIPLGTTPDVDLGFPPWVAVPASLVNRCKLTVFACLRGKHNSSLCYVCMY